MNRESRFIHQCVCSYLGNSSQHDLIRSFKRIDYDKLNTILRRSSLKGLFYYLFSNSYFECLDIPDYVIKSCREKAWQNAFINSFYDADAVEIAKSFDKNEINYIYLKGAVCRKYYESDYIRSSMDIDLYIDKTDYPAVKKIVQDHGYVIPHDHYGNIGITMDFDEFEDYFKEIAFIKKQKTKQIVLDIQWDFIGFGKAAPFEEMYNINSLFITKSNAFFKLNGYNVKTLPPDKELYIMVFHYIFHHSFRGIKWILDICNYINKINVPMTELVTDLTPDGKKLMGLCLLMANEFSGKPKPSKSDMKLLNLDRLMPFEYSFYKSLIYKPHEGVIGSITYRLTKALLPYTYRGKLRVLRYILFSSDSLGHRIEPDSDGQRKLNPVTLAKIAISDIFRHKRKANEKQD